MATFDKYDDIIDSRDVIARIEELEAEREALNDHLSDCESAYGFHDSDDTKSTPEWDDLQAARAALKEWDDDNDAELAAATVTNTPAAEAPAAAPAETFPAADAPAPATDAPADQPAG